MVKHLFLSDGFNCVLVQLKDFGLVDFAFLEDGFHAKVLGGIVFHQWCQRRKCFNKRFRSIWRQNLNCWLRRSSGQLCYSWRLGLLL
jgi:hypothetical protein